MVTEKGHGLRIVSSDGKLSELIRGTPKVYDDGFLMPGLKIVYGMGYLLDVALHPDYQKNGWIYLSYTDRCNDCNEVSRKTKRPVSMNKLIRGRIRDGEWVDQETIWSTDIEKYTGMIDMAAGGRIAFDGKGTCVPQHRHQGRLGICRSTGPVAALRKDPSRQRRWHHPGRQSLRQDCRCSPQHLDLRPPQPSGPGVQPQDREAVGNGNGPEGRRRSQPAIAR